MTDRRRIALNLFATYGRQAVALLCSFFTTRWVLIALGTESYGLYGLIGGLSILLSIVGTELNCTLARFYAISLGKAKIAGRHQEGLQDCRRHFTIGVGIHVSLAVLLGCVGYYVGVYVIRNEWLQIPPQRIQDCVWLWFFTMASISVGILAAPFNAMFVAKQEIAELTVYSLMQTLMKTLFVFCMTLKGRDWLVVYGAVLALISILPTIILSARAVQRFPECRIEVIAIRDLSLLWEMLQFASMRLINGFSRVARLQCQEIILNRHFGPQVNAAYTVGMSLSVETAILANHLRSVFSPVIITFCGERRYKEMRDMSMNATKYGVALTAIFAIPILLENEWVLEIWLKNPPAHAQTFVRYLIGVVLIEKLTSGQMEAIDAMGRVTPYYLTRSFVGLLAIVTPLSLLVVWRCPEAVGLGMIIMSLLNLMIDIAYANVYADIPLASFVRLIVVPLGLAIVSSIGVGSVVTHHLAPSAIRAIITGVVADSTLLLIVWRVAMNSAERSNVIKFAGSLVQKTIRVVRGRKDG